MHHKLIRCPTCRQGDRLFKEIATDTLRLLLYDPLGSTVCQAWRMWEICGGTDGSLRQVGSQEENILHSNRLLLHFEHPQRSFQVRYIDQSPFFDRSEIQDHGAADHALKGNLIYRLAIFDTMECRLDMTAGMQTILTWADCQYPCL